MSITPKNWADFQHYKDRAPSWIKLHRGLLDNFDFHCLPLASRALAPMLWLLASEYDGGCITASIEEIAFRFRMSPTELSDALTPLVTRGFFKSSECIEQCKQIASTPLAERLPREREEEEKEEEKDAAIAALQNSSEETEFYRRGKKVLGDGAGGLIKNLLKAKGANLALARAALEQASTKANPREYIGAIIKGRGNSPEDLRARGEAW